MISKKTLTNNTNQHVYEINPKENQNSFIIYRLLRYILYIFLLFTTTQAYSGSNPALKFAISFFLIVIAENLFKRKFYILFTLIILDRLLLGAVDLTEFIYTVFDPTKTYYLMLEVFKIDRVFYLVATHICFIFLVFKKKEPNLLYPIIATFLVYSLWTIYPDAERLMFYLLYSFGFFSFVFIIYIVFHDYDVFSHRRMALMCVYFIYSSLLLIKHINQVGDFLDNFNLSYAFILVLLITTLILIGSEFVVQKLLHKYFIGGMTLLSLIFAFMNYSDKTELFQHVVFITIILLINKIVHDTREVFRERYRI